MKRLFLSLLAVSVIVGCTLRKSHPPAAELYMPPDVPAIVPATITRTVKATITPKLSGSPPVITVSPTNYILLPGNNATFSVIVTGAAPIAYQWYFNGSKIASATTNTYTATNIRTAGFYYVRVSNAFGTNGTSGYAAVGTTNISSLCNLTTPASATVYWCPSTNKAFRLYMGIGSVTNMRPDVYSSTNPCGPPINSGTNFFRVYTNAINIGNVTNYTFTNITRLLTNYFSISSCTTTNTGTNSYIESDYSGEVFFVAPNYYVPPSNFIANIKFINYTTVLLSSKVCPQSRITVWYTKNVQQPNWQVLLTNGVPDVYGNYFYYDLKDNTTNRFYKLQLQ